MHVQSNRPVSPLSVMEQHRKYEQYKNQAMYEAGHEGVAISRASVVRVVQESTEAIIRNLGTVITNL